MVCGREVTDGVDRVRNGRRCDAVAGYRVWFDKTVDGPVIERVCVVGHSSTVYVHDRAWVGHQKGADA